MEAAITDLPAWSAHAWRIFRAEEAAAARSLDR